MNEVQVWDNQFAATVREAFRFDWTPVQWSVFVSYCQANGLNPLAGDITPVKYGGKDPRIVYIMSITGHIKVAQRTGKFRGFAPPALIVRNKQSQELQEIPLILFDDTRHELVRAVARVLHADFPMPQEYTADLSFYKKDNDFWKGALAPNMLWKCACAVAIRRTFVSDSAPAEITSVEEGHPASSVTVTPVREAPKAPTKKRALPKVSAVDKWAQIEGYYRSLGIKKEELSLPYAQWITCQHFEVNSIEDIDDVEALREWGKEPLKQELLKEGYL